MMTSIWFAVVTQFIDLISYFFIFFLLSFWFALSKIVVGWLSKRPLIGMALVDEINCTPVADLKPGIRDVRIRCRVARIWNCTNPRLDNRIITVDLLLVDESGNAIQANARPRDSQWLRDSISEGNVYVCSDFIVVTAESNYRTCWNPDMISVARGRTKFDRCSETLSDTFPSNYFNFVQYDCLLDRADKYQNLSDVIGQLTSMGPIEHVYIKDNPVEKRSLELQNTDGTTVSATLWTAIAHQINDMHVQELMKDGCVIIILAAIAVTTYNGQVCLSSKSATKVYLNLPNSETSAFQLQLTAPTSLTLKDPAPTREQQMMRNRKNIADLLQLNARTDMAIRFTCAVTIKDINPFNGWWFLSCPKCNKKVKKVKTVNSVHYCRSCSIYIDDTPGFWYILELVVEDHTADCVFILFGNNAETLIGQSAADLATTNTNPFILPQAIKQLRGVSKIFEVELMHKYSSDNGGCSHPLSFMVTRTFEPPQNSPNSPTTHKKRQQEAERSTKQTDERSPQKPKNNKTLPCWTSKETPPTSLLDR